MLGIFSVVIFVLFFDAFYEALMTAFGMLWWAFWEPLGSSFGHNSQNWHFLWEGFPLQREASRGGSKGTYFSIRRHIFRTIFQEGSGNGLWSLFGNFGAQHSPPNEHFEWQKSLSNLRSNFEAFQGSQTHTTT